MWGTVNIVAVYRTSVEAMWGGSTLLFMQDIRGGIDVQEWKSLNGTLQGLCTRLCRHLPVLNPVRGGH